MQLSAARADTRALWHHAEDDLQVLGVWSEQRPDRGEDAEPLLAHHRHRQAGLIGVLDGAGGSGGNAVGRDGSGVVRTGAWVGSRVARAALAEWYVESGRPSSRADEAEELQGHLRRRLGAVNIRRSKVTGRMRRELPTTLAAVDYAVTPTSIEWQALWAGDSRCFLLQPNRGLQQLTRDDTEEHDALVLLREDPPMTNVVSADRDFWINRAAGFCNLPAVLICATDGFFGYVKTPAHFECVLLRTLSAAKDLSHWGALLMDAVQSYTADDASLALVAIGFPDLPGMQEAMSERAAFVAAEHWDPLQNIVEGDRDAFVAAREKSWATYRHMYESRLPRTVGERQS